MWISLPFSCYRWHWMLAMATVSHNSCCCIVCMFLLGETHWMRFHVICSFSLKTNSIWLHAIHRDSTVLAASNSTQTAKIALNLNNNVSCGDATKTRMLFVRQVCPCVPYRNILSSEENMENLKRLTEINKTLLFWKKLRRKMIRRKMPDEPGWCIFRRSDILRASWCYIELHYLELHR